MTTLGQLPRERNISHGREVIHIQVGKAGNAIGHEFWRDICSEHGIFADGSELAGTFDLSKERFREERLPVFFNEGSNQRWVPRCVLLDTNISDLAHFAQDKGLGDLYRPENIIGNDESCGNCYAKAFHTEGPDLADRCLETVRKEVERCDCLQGVQFCHSVSGGTGSGLTGLLLKTLHDYLDKAQQSTKCIMQTFTLAPAPGTSDVVLEPYNAALGFQDLLEYSDQVFLFDNAALTDICQKSLEQDVPRMQNLNEIIALCMSGITSCLRFSGPLNADLHKLQTNLVPFKSAQFLVSSIAPLTAEASKKYRKGGNVLDLAQQVISKDNVTVKCDPLNPGDQYHGVTKAIFLAAWASWRGAYSTKEVDQVLLDLQKDGSRFDRHFPDWIPNSIASNICRVEHQDIKESLVFTSNSTAVHEVFDRIIKQWDMLYSSKSYVHVFEQDGISQQDMQESKTILQYISDQYCEYARWEDKFFEDNVSQRAVINDRAVENDQQREIAQELQELMDGRMYITKVDARG